MAYVVDVLTLAAILVIAVQGYMLIKGLGGLLHLGHAVFYGLGAYGAAIASTRVLPSGAFLLSILVGGLTAMVGAIAIGFPAFRNRGRYFMIVTFAIQLIFVTLMINLNFTGGPDGISSIPGISFGPWQPTHNQHLKIGSLVFEYAHLKLAVMCVAALLSTTFCYSLIRSPYGRLVRAVRDDELAVEAYGRPPTFIKAGIFAIGAAVTGVAGALFAHHFNYVGPTQFELDTTILFLVMLIVGGQYNLMGATLGAIVMVLLLEALRFLIENVFVVPFEITAHVRQVVFAAILILILAFRSEGMLPEWLPKYRRIAGKGEREEELLAVPPVPSLAGPYGSAANPPNDEQPVLIAKGVTKSFGGVAAVSDASLDLQVGKVVAIIGPNGAGKTTLFNTLSGFVTPDGGTVFTNGIDVTGLDPVAVTSHGVARTFQDVRLWPRLTAIENILVARPRQPGETPWGLVLRWRDSRHVEASNRQDAWALLDRFGLADVANRRADQLSYAQRKMLSLARITSFDPPIMLLDEPTSGVDPKRLDTFLTHIREFARSDGRAVCLIEHNMDVVSAVADRVVFMDGGRVLAQGTPAEILGDRELMRVYLGHRELLAA